MIANALKTTAWVALIAGLLLTAATAQPATSAPSSAGSAGGYYIEFRVAQIGAYGHSYAAFGRLNGQIGRAHV